MFFDKALERAKFLDEYLEKNGKTLGPFHGLPISLKVMNNRMDIRWIILLTIIIGYGKCQRDLYNYRLCFVDQG